MAKKRRRVGSNSVSRPVGLPSGLPTGLPDLQSLEKMFGQILGLSRGPAQEETVIPPHVLELAGVSKAKTQTRSRNAQPFEATPQNWMERLEDAEGMYPLEFKFEKERLAGFQFQLEHVHPKMITGLCGEKGLENRFYVKFDNMPPAGCNCVASNSEFPCEHSYYFLHWLGQQLLNKNSAAYQKLQAKQYDGPAPPLSEFKTDHLAQHRRKLQRLLSSLDQTGEDEVDATSLPATAAKTKQRILWDFRVEHRQIFVDCVIQTLNKRGTAWSRGKKLSSTKLHENSELFQGVNQRVLRLAKWSQSTYYSKPQLELPVLPIALELIGQSNVLVMGIPGTVKLAEPTIYFGESEKECWLSPVPPASKSCVLFPVGNDLMLLDQKAATVEVAQLSPRQSEIVQQLISLSHLPIAMREPTISAAKKLQSWIKVVLPEQEAGEVRAESTRGALLLRLDADGVLNYGWRIRLGSGRLVEVGVGAPQRIQMEEDRPVRWTRSFQGERDLIQGWCQRLGLEAHQMLGALDDFDQVLQFTAQLQEIANAEQGDMGLEVLWSPDSQAPVKLLGSVTAKNLQVSVNRGRDWFQLSGNCDFGSQQVDLATLLKNLNSESTETVHGDYVKLGELGWAKISEALRKQLRRLRDGVNEERKNLVFDASSAPVIRELADFDVQVEATGAWNKCLDRMERAKNLNPQLPAGLQAELRTYQEEGFAWMRRLAEWGVGGILADDMGLGKTLQTLAVLLDRSEQGPALVVAPTSVGFNWVREIERFAPGLKAIMYRESDREQVLHEIQSGSVVICSYGLALRDIEKLSAIQWNTLVLDEAQAIKNARSKTALALATVKADWKVALTGTPVENHLGELWSLFRVVAPGVFGAWEQFRKRFAAPIEKDNDEERRLALRDRLQPFVLRRTKSEVLKDLPPRTDSNLYIELTPDERTAYDRVRLSALGELDAIAKLDDIKDQRFKVFALLTRLRQFACSPKLVHPEWPGRSSKLQCLAETLHELKSEGHRALVFSQFVGHLQLIKEMMDEEKLSYQYLDGSTTPNARKNAVDAFQSGQGDAFLISLKAGGTGLNLTAADYVIHMDPWWNPAVEDQATDRAHRIGQDKPVLVYRMVSQGTIEEEILKLHETKRDLVASIIEGNQAAAKLSTEDLIQMIRGQ